VTLCERVGCEELPVWGVGEGDGWTTHWCNEHMITFANYRNKAFIPAGSPQLTLSEVQAL